MPTRYVYSAEGEYAGAETDGDIVPSFTDSGVILREWMSGCPGVVGYQDGDLRYDTPTTVYPDDPLFGLALIECIEANDWVITEETPIDGFMSPTVNAITKKAGGGKNCGIGAGGFQHGNTCARGSGGAITIPGLGDFKKIKDLPGSTGPILVEGPGGKKYVMKSGKGKEPHLKSEVQADEAYRALGIPVPKSWIHELQDGSAVKLSEYIEGGETFSKWKEGKTDHQIQKMKEEIGKHLAVDAVLANWDVAGLSQDNLLIKDGVPYRIDNGGALAYRAQGSLKGSAWGPDVTEHKTLRDSSKNPTAADIFKHVTDKDLLSQANDLYLNKGAVLSAIDDPKTKDIVNERINNLMGKMTGDAAKTVTPKLATTPTPPAATQSPGGKVGGDPLHSAEGVTKFIHANKGNVQFSDLYTEKLQAMNPNGVKDGVFLIPSFPTGEKSSLDKVAQLEKILPPGTIIKKKSITAKQVEEWKVKQKGMTPEEAKATTKPITPGKPKAAPVTPLVVPPTPPVVPPPPPPPPVVPPPAVSTPSTTFLNKSTTPGTGEHVLQTIAKNINGDPAKIASEVSKLTPAEKGQLKAHLGLQPGQAGTAAKLVEALQGHGIIAAKTPSFAPPPEPKKGGKPAGAKETWWTPDPAAPDAHDYQKYMPPITDGSKAVMQFSPLYSIEENQKWADSLTLGENSAVGSWKGSAKAIREAVTNGTATPGTTAGNFMSAITKSPPHQGVVYRGIWDDGKTNYATATAKYIESLGVGGTWSDPAPHCMSPNSNRGNAFSKGDVMFRVITKTGRPIQKAGNSFLHTGPSEEMEVVGMPGTQYRIKAIAKNVQTTDDYTKHPHSTVKYLIDLEEI